MRYSKSIAAGAFLALAISLISFVKPHERYFEIVKNLDIFATLFKEVNAYYVDEINPNNLVETGIDAMLRSLDPYTNFIPEDDIEDYRTLTTGEYGGIGAIIGKRLGKNMVVMPYKNSPAFEAGLKVGDELIKINEVDVSDKTTTEISKLLKGQSGSNISITVKRFDTQEILTFDLQREKIVVDNVPYFGMVDHEVGYMRLTDFTTNASKEVRSAIQNLKKQGAKSLILDLRDNPGGLLNEAVNISNLFVPKGVEIVSTKGKVKDWNKTYYALDNPVDTEIPLVVLTNNRSASASEIVAGVVQDYDRGVLVGQKTFGKGLVQATRPLTYNSQLKVTTAKYYTPSGRCIQAIDYSHRNEDGSVGKIPDSLKTEFTTTRGRKVYDGGGIDPDVQVKGIELSPISISLISKSLIFEYATRYYYDHPEISEPSKFTLTDAEYDEFKEWLSGKDYSYKTKTESRLNELEKLFEEESFYDEVKEQLTSLQQEIKKSKENDLEEHKTELKEYLEQEIASRYYLEEGAIESSFDSDEDILEAISVLKDPQRYSTLLAVN